ncbi:MULTISPECIES: RluA family pseudouridine synthase [Methylobacterium]|uniref:Dual-specificity RNA pseudouridine synthase RluA n=2 Tax=Pseudomonadota TaxID=1224 RepID=A0ABQ4SV98_9HYPH|nr:MULTISPECIES: RluA family pseudouridine synthase [Methylobacterium]PIU05582.1 MAG: RNA pseudouridine synthase [Methylobacterium sp. CG09_land_8_20_14_0_10_71_15]PIU14757.1 MAG: RNA pseudouridine synthase [Methylobacterium sp. CG08_land_8_20_14_0_20_71_15]GBU18408.1 23S rRNA/tRNA pseudouridine synthase A [Methylobacterium sp.]GJE05823.1 Dual-specificity RNA pseudouridine synthase RluA [Methylobacterium jeotgali]
MSPHPANPHRTDPQHIGVRLLYRDALLLVIDKPAGMPVHPGPKGGETLTDHLDALRFGLPRRPEAVHRLDRDTSGCLALGRHAKALARLNRLFAGRETEKVYWALVEGTPPTEEGRIDLPLMRRSDDPRSWWMKADPAGDPALTHWRILGCTGDGSSTWLELRPVTGRTHQLRVHCAALGFPIRGDAIYGSGPRTSGPGLQLHARRLVLPLYPKRQPIAVEAPVPAHMRAGLEACGMAAGDAEMS